jgi:3-oxoacyl-[acyl-carrier protein] reductase
MNLEGKVAIVTGASEGIGLGISSALAKEGVKVYLVARTLSKLEEAKEKIEKQGGNAEARSADITKFDTIKKIIDEVYESEKHLDIFVNNAGIWKGQSIDTDFSEIKDLIDFNLISPYHISHYLSQKFMSIPDNHLKILTVVSQASVKVFPNGLGYGPAKMALTSALMHLRKELELNKIDNINLYNLYPNTVATEKMIPAIKAGQVDNPVNLESVVDTAIVLLKEEGKTNDARIGFYPGRGIIRTYFTSNPDQFYNPPIELEETLNSSFDPSSL